MINGWEKGIASSPHKGIANMQGVNIATETGEAMCSYNRVLQSQPVVGTLTLTRVNTNTVSFSGNVLIGTWLTIVADSGTGLSGNYYVESVSGAFKLSTTFAQDNSTIVSGINAGTATFTVKTFANPLYSTIEPYLDSAGTSQTRYYILDSNGRTWVHDSHTLTGIDTPLWFLPSLSASVFPTGLAVLNGWLNIMDGSNFTWKSTSTLGVSPTTVTGLGALINTQHASLIGHQGKMYYTDGNFLGSLFPNSSLITGGANIQSYCSYTAVTTTGTATLIGGSYPTLGAGSTIRIPVWFFTAGTKPAAITLATIYYILWLNIGTTFEVYAAASGGSAIDIQTGAVGTQYFNTFSPIFGSATYTFTPERLNLPFVETSQSLAEIGNIVLVGCKSNTIYQWDQVSPTPQDFIVLPENNTVSMITVNNMGYIFCGQKGNIYITNGSSASLVISVPDYCAGIASTPASYIEPYFTWGGVMYLRGKVWFSILDQTATKAGNCGGIWSFVPTNNFYIGQDTGLALRLENQSSYATYNGVSTLLIPSQIQTAIGPQYWSAWYSNISAPTYGIDFSDTITTPAAVIETDLIPTGTLLGKKTFQQIEYKLSTPLASGETVGIAYRQNSTDSFTSCGIVITEGATELSGYFVANFQNGQWLQLKITLTPLATSSSSFVRLSEIRVR